MLGDDRRDQVRRRDVERGIACGEAGCDFGRGTLLDRNPGTARRREVDGRRRCDDVERNVVVRSQDGEGVRADLVRCVPVRRDPVRAGDDAIDLACGHERGRRGVGDHRMRDARGLQLPRGQTRPLQQRTGLVDPDAFEQAALPGRP